MKLNFKKNKEQNSKGFTIVELLVYISIASIMFTAIASFASALLKWRVKNQVITEVEQQGAYTMQMITRTVRNAEGINNPSPGVSGFSLLLDVVDAGNDPTIFDVDTDVLRIKEGASVPIELTDSHVLVSDFLVENLSGADTPGIIKAQFTLSYVNPGNRSERNYSKTFYSSASLR